MAASKERQIAVYLRQILITVSGLFNSRLLPKVTVVFIDRGGLLPRQPGSGKSFWTGLTGRKGTWPCEDDSRGAERNPAVTAGSLPGQAVGSPTRCAGELCYTPAAPWGQSNRAPWRHCQGLMNSPCQIPRLASQASSSAATYRFEKRR